MPNLPTHDQLRTAGQNEVQSRNPSLTDFSEGSNLDALTGSAAVLADETSGTLVDLFAAHFVDTAEGADLDALALDRFGLTRNLASAAVGNLTFTRGSSSGNLPVPFGTVVEAEVEGQIVSFTTTAVATIPNAVSSVEAPAIAAETGRGGNVAAGTITKIVTPVPGDATATVNNLTRMAGGSEDELDPAFRDRIRSFFRDLRRGTISALITGAMEVDGVVFAAVDESTIDTQDAVSVYIGDPEGTGNAVLAALVATELEDWRAAGIQVVVVPATREEILMSLTVTHVRGADTDALDAAIRAAVLGYTDNLLPNETLYGSKVESQAHSVDVSQVRGVAMSVPSVATLDPSSGNQALRVLAGDLTLTFVSE